MEFDFTSNRTSSWPFFKNIFQIIQNAGMDDATLDEGGAWLATYNRLSLDGYKSIFFQTVDSMKTLQWYRTFKRSTFRADYIFNTNDFWGVRLKLKARIGCLGLQVDQNRWRQSGETCMLCTSGKEDLEHFMVTCPFFNDLRVNMYQSLEQQLMSNGYFSIWQSFISSSVVTKLWYLLGDLAHLIDRDAFIIFDGACRGYLNEAWKRRNAYMDSHTG